MLGVMALVVVMSVMNGFRADLFDKIVGLNGHAVMQGYSGRLPDWREIIEESREMEGVVSATPLIEQPLMASYDGRVEGVLARGMLVEDIRGNAIINENIVAGDMHLLTPGSGRVAIGSRLATALGANTGGQISLISPQGRTTPFGTVPRIVSYDVAAIFEVGVYDFDKAFVLMPMEDAQTLLMLDDAVGMIEFDTTDPENVGQILAPIAINYAGQGVLTDWREMNSQLFDALAIERVVMFWVLSLIILVAVFNILSSLIMLVRARKSAISPFCGRWAHRARSMMKIFLTIGMTTSTLGTLAGLGLGFLLLHFPAKCGEFRSGP